MIELLKNIFLVAKEQLKWAKLYNDVDLGPIAEIGTIITAIGLIIRYIKKRLR